MDTPLQNSVGLSLVPRVREGVWEQDYVGLVYTSSSRWAAKVGWKRLTTSACWTLFGRFRPTSATRCRYLAAFRPIHAALDAGVRRSSDCEGSRGDERSPFLSKCMPTTCAEGALCASTIITKGCTALWGENESNTGFSLDWVVYKLQERCCWRRMPQD